MLNATTHIKRTIVLAGALAAVAAPSACARVAADAANVPSPPAASRSAEPAGPTPSLADLQARREALANKQWQAANRPTVIELSSPSDGGSGLDLPSVGIGAAIPLTLVLMEVVGKRVLRRRRESQVRHQVA